jgi:kinesin family protein 5
VWIEGVTELYVASVDDVLQIIDAGTNNRAIASTRMNMESSRSHSVFMLSLNKTDTQLGMQQLI